MMHGNTAAGEMRDVYDLTAQLDSWLRGCPEMRPCRTGVVDMLRSGPSSLNAPRELLML